MYVQVETANELDHRRRANGMSLALLLFSVLFSDDALLVLYLRLFRSVCFVLLLSWCLVYFHWLWLLCFVVCYHVFYVSLHLFLCIVCLVGVYPAELCLG